MTRQQTNKPKKEKKTEGKYQFIVASKMTHNLAKACASYDECAVHVYCIFSICNSNIE